MIIDSVDEARNVTMLVGTNDKAFWRCSCWKQCHCAVSIVIFAVLQIINISNIFCDYCQIPYVFISLNCEPVNESLILNQGVQLHQLQERMFCWFVHSPFFRIENNHEGRTFSSLHHAFAQIQRFNIFFRHNLEGNDIRNVRFGSHST